MIQSQLIDEDSKNLVESVRLKSYDAWPNDRNWFCTPEKLAKAGFYFKPDGECLDNVCCAFCKKELDGWEPDDDPVAEHKKHSPKCPFLNQKTSIEELTMEEFLRFIGKIKRIRAEQEIDKMKKKIQEDADAAEKLMLSIFKSS